MNCLLLPRGCAPLLLSPQSVSEPASGGGFSFRNEPISFFDPSKPVSSTFHNRQHWQQGDVPCFCTWRMGDSLPQSTLRKWKAEQNEWLRLHPRPWSIETEFEYLYRYERGINQRLRQGIGSCPLRDPEIARIVADALQHFNGKRYQLFAFVIMPNHVHVLFRPHPDFSISDIVKSWKWFTARQINKRLRRKGRLWAEEYHTHLIRGEIHFRNAIRYIRRNPGKARLAPAEYLLWKSPEAVQTSA